jgi:hypothetical protein
MKRLGISFQYAFYLGLFVQACLYACQHDHTQQQPNLNKSKNDSSITHEEKVGNEKFIKWLRHKLANMDIRGIDQIKKLSDVVIEPNVVGLTNRSIVIYKDSLGFEEIFTYRIKLQQSVTTDAISQPIYEDILSKKINLTNYDFLSFSYSIFSEPVYNNHLDKTGFFEYKEIFLSNIRGDLKMDFSYNRGRIDEATEYVYDSRFCDFIIEKRLYGFKPQSNKFTVLEVIKWGVEKKLVSE